MNEKTVRDHMETIRARLRQLDTERDVLGTLLKGYEGWLRVYINGGTPSQLPLQAMRSTIQGKMSIRRAVIQVLKDARGEPLHCKEIWRRAQEIGAKSKAKNPIAAIDFTGYTLPEIKKVAPRTWKYIGDTQPERHPA